MSGDHDLPVSGSRQNVGHLLPGEPASRCRVPTTRMSVPGFLRLCLLLILLAVGTFLAGVNLLSLQVSFLGVAMALSIPAMTWLKQASLLLLLAGVAVVGLAIAFWPRGSKRAT